MQVISADALRMRLRRLCTPKKNGKLWVSTEVAEDYKMGGSAREALELTLLETIKTLGDDSKKPEKIRVGVGQTS